RPDKCKRCALVECKVLPTEGPILALRLVDHRDVRRYLRLVDQPVEVGSRTVGRITRKPFGLDVKALLGARDHGPGRVTSAWWMARDASTSMMMPDFTSIR